MAHELTFINGRAQFFAVKDSAWHREGEVLTEAPTWERALEIGGLDYEVVKVPTYREIEVAGIKDYVQNDKAWITKRMDTGAELGSVGPDYTVVQNRDAFEILRPLTESGVAQVETGGVLREGADAFMLLQFSVDHFGPIVREVFANEVAPYVLVATNHAGRRGVLFSLTPIRVVCANTLGMVEAGAVAREVIVQHRGDAKVRLVEAAETMLGGVIERYERLAEGYRTLKARTLTEAEFSAAILDVISPDPRRDPQFNPEAKLAGLVLERADRRRGELRRLWDEGAGHTGDRSAWEAYNAAVEAIDHNRELYPVRAGSWRSASLLDGRLRQLKDRALASVEALARD